MIAKIFVVAKTARQFEQWCKENRIHKSSDLVCYIPENDGPRILSGIINPQIIYYGNYYDRNDIDKIKELVKLNTFKS